MLLFLTNLPLSLFLILSTCVNLSLQLYLFNSCVTFPLPLYLCHFSSTNLTLSLLLYLSKPVSLFLYCTARSLSLFLFHSTCVTLSLPLYFCYSYSTSNHPWTCATQALQEVLPRHLHVNMLETCSCLFFFCEINRFWWSDLSLSPAVPRFWKYAQENLFPVFIKCWLKKGFLLSFFFS